MIWNQPVTLESVRKFMEVNMLAHLDIRIEEIGDDFVKASMPVDHRTQQPFGLLHGGASVVLAETVGSIGASLTLDASKHIAVGAEINANHLRPAKQGRVYALATPLKIGRGLQVWDIKITDDQEKLVCASRITMAVISR